MVRTLTVEMLKYHAKDDGDEEEDERAKVGSPKTKKKKENGNEKSDEQRVENLSSLLQDRVYEDFFDQAFEIEDRCRDVDVDTLKFSVIYFIFFKKKKKKEEK
ncbi:hypothetical protein RFI_08816 [Reticulomyxa filosa]|uniref:Uncharacterized protein n=1 Tax=Reticulomyxa filosa TaxID=46433 RepID=X6NQN0_RETFI|nr:hypothetical protein RFI_08816 [Reticulomyxa filosa]|eukprot:ETO28316.1 hypothetical protein RFI_08816 [Reticulomyxa filosa]